MASDRGKWWLDFIAYFIGILALWLLIDDSVISALESVMMVEKAGSAWNSPQPMILKSMLTLGAIVYITSVDDKFIQTFFIKLAKNIVLIICSLNFIKNYLCNYCSFYW